MKTFVLAHENARANAIRFISEAKLDGTLKVEIKKVTSIRNLAQNALFHAWNRTIANDLGYTELEMKTVLVQEHLTPAITQTLDGRKVEVWPSTARLGVKQFAEFLTKVEIFSSTLGIILDKSSDDYYEAIAKYQK